MILPIRRRVAGAAALALLATAAVSPATAAPPDRIEVDVFTISLDLKHQLVVFWNISRDDFCAWEESEFDGPPPVTMLVPAQEHVVRGEVRLATFRGTSRTNSFGQQLNGKVVDVDGNTWRFSMGFQLRIDRSGEFHFITERFTLAGGH